MKRILCSFAFALTASRQIGPQIFIPDQHLRPKRRTGRRPTRTSARRKATDKPVHSLTSLSPQARRCKVVKASISFRASLKSSMRRQSSIDVPIIAFGFVADSYLRINQRKVGDIWMGSRSLEMFAALRSKAILEEYAQLRNIPATEGRSDTSDSCGGRRVEEWSPQKSPQRDFG